MLPVIQFSSGRTCAETSEPCTEARQCGEPMEMLALISKLLISLCQRFHLVLRRGLDDPFGLIVGTPIGKKMVPWVLTVGISVVVVVHDQLCIGLILGF